MSLADGTLLGRYEIRSHLGAGGMGEVYLAHDTQLERTVALKILPEEVASDSQRMQRFVQEARTASALNHPNIITIYEIGHVDSTRFISTEFIDGRTLRENMTQTRLELPEALDIAIQVASALSAAHAAGIVHRDIKPENIMVRPDGYVKVLDFGLAKPTEREKPALDTEAPTRALVQTEPGKIMGTVSYMSPEQARGDELDARTDIWSFGCVLYEMIAGHKPFEGATPSHVIVSILDREPQPLAGHLGGGVTAELQLIVKKALRKDVEARYQTIKDLLFDLRSLKQELEFESKLERSTPPDASSSDVVLSTSGLQAAYGTASGPVARTVEVGAAATTSPSGATPVAAVKSSGSNAKWIAIAAVGLIAITGIAGLLYLLLQHRAMSSRSTPFQVMKITRLTSTGKTANATISPDGKYVVYEVSSGDDQRSIWVRQVVTNSNVTVVPPAPGVRYLGLTFSKDGNYVYYVKKERNSLVGELFQVGVLGGDAKKIIYDVDSAITFSPDGKRLAFMRGDPNQKEIKLITANVDGTGEKMIARRLYPESWDAPVWSPDGKVIACLAWSTSGVRQANVVEVPAEGGAEKPITAPSRLWWRTGNLAWASDSSGLLVNAPTEEAPTSMQIWHISYPGGEARRVTNDLNFYRSVSLTADSNALVTVQVNQISNVWVAPPTEAASRARQVTMGADNYFDPVFAPDGRIVYVSITSGNPDIWIMNQDRSNQKQLTFDAGQDLRPTVSSDGRYIVYTSDHSGVAPNIWRMDIDGGSQKQLTNGKGENLPQLTPDGQWVVYVAYSSGNPSLWKVSIDGGEPVQLTDKYTNTPVISPDGKFIACTYWDSQQISTPIRVALFSIDGGEPVKTFDMSDNNVRWTADGRALSYIDTRSGISNIWIQPVDGKKPTQLTDFNSDHIFNYSWSQDGKQLVLSRGVVTSDVVLISGFNQPQDKR